MSSDFPEITLEEIIQSDGSAMMKDGDWIESKDQDPAGDVRLIQLADIGDGTFKNVSSRFLTSEKAKELGCTYLQAGDLLIARMPDPIGRCAILPDLGQEAVTAVDVCIVRPSGTVDRDWLKQVINSPQIRYRIRALAGGGTRQRISTSELRNLKLFAPGRRIQRRISEILRTWDMALEKLIALRAAKARRLDAIAQRLLAPSRTTGRGIPRSDWATSCFGEVFEERQDRNVDLSSDDVVTVGKYAIRKQSDHFKRSVASKDLSNYWIISPGDFVYDPMSAYYGAIGRFSGSADGIVSPAYRVIRLSPGVDPEFMVALLRTHHIRFLLETRSSQGNREGKRRLLQRDEFESIEFKLPSIETQRGIAAKIAVFRIELDLTDREIEALSRQKCGLMQKLLTGEWQFTINEAPSSLSNQGEQ